MATVIEGEAAVRAAQRSGLVQPNLAPPSRRYTSTATGYTNQTTAARPRPPPSTSTASGYANQTSAPAPAPAPAPQPRPPQPTSTATGYTNQTSAPAPESPRSSGLSKSGATALIVLFVIAIAAGLLVWGVAFHGSAESGKACNNSSESSQCKNSSPSFDNCCKCDGGNSSGKDQSSDNQKCSKSDNDAGKSHQS